MGSVAAANSLLNVLPFVVSRHCNDTPLAGVTHIITYLLLAAMLSLNINPDFAQPCVLVCSSILAEIISSPCVDLFKNANWSVAFHISEPAASIVKMLFANDDEALSF